MSPHQFVVMHLDKRDYDVPGIPPRGVRTYTGDLARVMRRSNSGLLFATSTANHRLTSGCELEQPHDGRTRKLTLKAPPFSVQLPILAVHNEDQSIGNLCNKERRLGLAIYLRNGSRHRSRWRWVSCISAGPAHSSLAGGAPSKPD